MDIEEDIGLEYNKSRENNFDYECGWVLPNGLFYGFEEGQHDCACEYHFDIGIRKAEELGWARLTRQQPFFQCLKHYTKAQINTISEYYEYGGAVYALKLFYEEVKEQDS